MGLICIGNWKVPSFPLHSLSQFLFLLHLSLKAYEANEFSISFLGLKSNTHTFHFSPLRLLLNSQPPAPRLDVGVFSQFFVVVVGIFLVFISFSYNLAIENISFSDSHPHKMLQIVPTMRSCCCCCFFCRFFFFPILLWFFGLCLTHTHTHRE